MGFFGFGKRPAPQPAPASTPAPQRPGPDRGDLAEAAVRGGSVEARTRALAALLADPAANAAQLSIVAVQDADGAQGLRAVAALAERRQLKTVAKKAKVASVRDAAVARLAALDDEARRPSQLKARAEMTATLEALIPRATRLAVGNGEGAEAAWAAIAQERDAALGCGVEPDEAAAQALVRLDALAHEVQARISDAAARAEAARQAALVAEAERQSAEAARAVADAERAARTEAPAPEGFAAVVARAEELAAAEDPEAGVDEFLRLHKEALRLGDGLDVDHELRVRFAAAWDAHRAARRRARQQQGERRGQALAELAAHVAEAERLAAAADGIAPDDAAALESHRAALEALRQGFRLATRAVPPNEARAPRERFQALLDDAYAPLRAAREAADAESFTNLVRAEQLKDEVEALPVDADPEAAFRGLKDCQARWRRLGPLPRARARAAWDAFRAAGDSMFARLKPWLAAQDQERQAAMARREELCVQAEAVLAAPTVGLAGSPAERDARRAAGLRMQALQRAWREAGDVPRGMDRELWNRFTTAQDAFWQRHKADLDDERQRREAVLAERVAVIEGAEAFAADAEKAMAARSGVMTAADVQRRVGRLREQWRALPPPPREARAAIDTRFDAAVDRILATIRGKLDAERAALEAAAAARRTLLDELAEILDGENPRWQTDAVDRIRQAWRDAGRVPIEDRESLDRRFAELMSRWRTLAAAAT